MRGLARLDALAHESGRAELRGNADAGLVGEGGGDVAEGVLQAAGGKQGEVLGGRWPAEQEHRGGRDARLCVLSCAEKSWL